MSLIASIWLSCLQIQTKFTFKLDLESGNRITVIEKWVEQAKCTDEMYKKCTLI